MTEIKQLSPEQTKSIRDAVLSEMGMTAGPDDRVFIKVHGAIYSHLPTSFEVIVTPAGQVTTKEKDKAVEDDPDGT